MIIILEVLLRQSRDSLRARRRTRGKTAAGDERQKGRGDGEAERRRCGEAEMRGGGDAG